MIKSNVKIGTKVTMNNKYIISDKNKNKIFIVCSAPWNVCGTMVVKLEGISGGYAIDGLELAVDVHNE